MTDVRQARQSVSVLTSGSDSIIRVAQQSVSVLISSTTPSVIRQARQSVSVLITPHKARLYSDSVDVLYTTNPDVRLYSGSADVLYTTTPVARLYSGSADVLYTTTPVARLYSGSADVLYQTYYYEPVQGLWGLHMAAPSTLPSIVASTPISQNALASFAQNIPGGPVADDLIVLWLASPSTASSYSATGFTKIADQSDGSSSRSAILVKKAAGGESSVTVTVGSTQRTAGAAMLIRNWFGNLNALTVSSTFVATGNPDPPEVGTSASRRLVLALAGWRTPSYTLTSTPTGYSAVRYAENSTEIAATAYALAEEGQAGSVDPSTFTLSTLSYCTAHTLIIPR